jgi:hypothetical protein
MGGKPSVGIENKAFLMNGPEQKKILLLILLLGGFVYLFLTTEADFLFLCSL